MKKSILLTISFSLFSFIAFSQKIGGIKGLIVNSETGVGVISAQVSVLGEAISVTSSQDGDFRISTIPVGKTTIEIVSLGYQTLSMEVDVAEGVIANIGTIRLHPIIDPYFNDEEGIITFDESQLDDESGSSQSIGNLSGASYDVYLSTASYAFGATRFRIRGYDSDFSSTYINGINFDDPARGYFNYSMLGGMNNAFRNKNVVNGIDFASFTFGDIGGAVNISTKASMFSPGSRANIAFTNRNYKWRGMFTYATGVRPDGWSFAFSAIGRFADEGVVPGTFYRSWGYFITAEKILNDKNTIMMTTFGAPTQRGQASATYEEVYNLTSNNLYNPNWGYQNGKKRNSRVVESYDPSFILNWEWKPDISTTLRTGAAFKMTNYSSSALNWYNAADPRPDYYRYLPSYYSGLFGTADPYAQELLTSLWENDLSFRQIDWDKMYQVNYLNNWENENRGKNLGSTYILENRYSNQINYMFNTNLNKRLSDYITLQAGAGFKYTNASFFKKIDDLLGGEYWLDIDQYAEQDFPNNPDILQNNLNNPNFRAKKGDKFGYNYDINYLNSNLWLQNNFNLPHWDAYYSGELSYTQFQRDGKMRNERAPDNSFGKSEMKRYLNFGVKAGATYKLDGRNYFTINALYETVAPHFANAYISPRIKDTPVPNLKNQKIISADITYRFAYQKLKGRITAFATNFYDQTEVSSFFHNTYQTLVNYILTGVRKRYQGIELGIAYKMTPALTASFVGTVARYRYVNQPEAITNYENGSLPDDSQTAYLKNFYVAGTPQQVFNLGLKWAAPKLWFFDVNVSAFDMAYVSLSPSRRTESAMGFELTGNTQQEMENNYIKKAKEITCQQKLNGGWLLNASVGKLVYLDRKRSLNVNVGLNNILNYRNLQTGGYEQGRFDYTDYNVNKYPNKYYYGQGINVFVSVGVKF
ncbi:MAG: TonB-dependent receptor [Bacteroidales bacterium]|nr:TonB-dependent receptor [Bacteroidales bacterium]